MTERQLNRGKLIVLDTNGLTYATERLKSQKIHGHITFKTSEKSELAAVAAEYL